MFFFFFNDTATTEIYTLSLHDALPIYVVVARELVREDDGVGQRRVAGAERGRLDAGHRGCPASASTCARSEEHTSELQSQSNLVCRLLLEKNKYYTASTITHTAPFGGY